MLVNVPVPPLKFSVAVPSESPLQLTLVVFEVTDIALGSVMTTDDVNEHPLLSVTVYGYVPAGIPDENVDVDTLSTPKGRVRFCPKATTV